MSKAKELDDLAVWVNARRCVRNIYQLTAKAPGRHDYSYCNQLRSASVSIMSNIAEGYGRSSDKDSARFLDIARGSALETQSLVCVGLDVTYLDPETFDELTDILDHIIAQITSLSRYLRDGRIN